MNSKPAEDWESLFRQTLPIAVSQVGAYIETPDLASLATDGRASWEGHNGRKKAVQRGMASVYAISFHYPHYFVSQQHSYPMIFYIKLSNDRFT